MSLTLDKIWLQFAAIWQQLHDFCLPLFMLALVFAHPALKQMFPIGYNRLDIHTKSNCRCVSYINRLY